jgi:hypothetical protein
MTTAPGIARRHEERRDRLQNQCSATLGKRGDPFHDLEETTQNHRHGSDRHEPHNPSGGAGRGRAL